MADSCPDCGVTGHPRGSRFCYACGAELRSATPVDVAAVDARGFRAKVPFVGREQELAELERLLQQARSRRLTHVELRGESGIGKTRLADELIQRLSSDAVVLHARCRPGAGMRAYALWLDLLRRWHPRKTGFARAAAVEKLIGASGERRASGRRELADAVWDLLSSAAREAPERLLVLVLDDLHWADPSSLQMLRSVLERNADAPVLILATARPELPPDWAGSRMIERIEIGPLSSFDCGVLARALLGGVPSADRLASIALERAGGNPLFLEHVCRTLVEGSDALRAATRVEASLRSASERLPDSLRDLVGERVDRLSARQREILAVAAVIGAPFAADAIARRELGLDRDGLGTELEELVARGLLARAPDGVLEFADELLAEAAYDAIPRTRRHELHRALAESLAGEPGADTPERASLIGHHFERARDAGQAAHYLARAGAAFLELFAPAEAASHLRRVWALYHGELDVSDRQRAAVGLSLAAALNALDRHGEAGAILEALDPEDFSESDHVAAGAIFIQGGWAQYGGCRAERARGLVQRGLSLVEGKPGGEPHLAMALAFLSRIEQLDGAARGAVAHAERVIAAATAAGDLLGQILGFAYAADARCDLGALDRAWEDARTAMSLADSEASDLARSLAYAHAAKVYLHRGDAAGALHAARVARRAAESGGRQEDVLSHCAFLSGHAHLLLGEPEKAALEFQRFAEIDPDTPARFDHGARGALALGRSEEAIRMARRCLEMDPPRLVRIRALRTLAQALARASPAEADAAEAAARESLELAERLGLPPHVAESALALAEVAALRGQTLRARELHQRAAFIFESCGMPVPSAGMPARLRSHPAGPPPGGNDGSRRSS